MGIGKGSLLFSFLLFFFSLNNQLSARIFSEKNTLMGTDINITVSTESEELARKGIKAALTEVKRIEDLMTTWREESPFSQINKNAGKVPVAAPEEIIEVVKRSIYFSESTGGAFDISYAGLSGLWNFYDGRRNIPSEKEIKEKLPLVSYRNIILEKKTIFISMGMRIDLGGIAKGYAIDKAIEVLNKMDIHDVLISAGGDMRAQGKKDGAPWKIGIRHPRDAGKLIGTIRAENISISTSGDYERFFIKEGKRYHHILDPRTGYPADKSRSVTVIGPRTMDTDALSTSIFILGPEEGMKFIEKNKDFSVIIIDEKGNISLSGDLQNIVNLNLEEK